MSEEGCQDDFELETRKVDGPFLNGTQEEAYFRRKDHAYSFECINVGISIEMSSEQLEAFRWSCGIRDGKTDMTAICMVVTDGALRAEEILWKRWGGVLLERKRGKVTQEEHSER